MKKVRGTKYGIVQSTKYQVQSILKMKIEVQIRIAELSY